MSTASRAQAQGTIRVPLVARPEVMASKQARLAAWLEPTSSQLTISRRWPGP